MKKIIAILLSALMILGALSGCSTQSKSTEFDLPALKVSNTEYTVAELNYMYVNLFNDVYSTYYNYYGDSIDQILDVTKPLEEQNISDDSTWHDYLLGYVEYGLTNITVLYEQATAEGFVLPDDYAESLASLKTDIEASAEEYGVSFDEYIEVMYGKGMTYDTVYKMTEINYIAGAYSENYEANIKVSLDEIREKYQEDKGSYDAVNFLFSSIYSDSEEPTDEEKAENKAKAEKVMEAKTPEEFADAAWDIASDEYKEYYDKESMTTYKGATKDDIGIDGITEWLFDDARVMGESYLYEDETYGGYIPVMFLEKTSADYDTVNVRHILITPEENEEGEVTDEAKAAAKEKAEQILADFLAGEATEEAFATLATENSNDAGTASTGGLMENTQKNQTVTGFNEWIFDSDRKTGDTAVVETTYGYHVMYFCGTGENNLYLNLHDTMVTEKFNTWVSGLSVDVEAERLDAFEKVGGMIDDIVAEATAHDEALAAESETEDGTDESESTESTDTSSEG